MKNKQLIFISFMALATLLLLEGYLLQNTYKLKTELYRRNTVKSVFQVYNLPFADSIYWEYRNDLKNHLKDYISYKISKEELQYKFEINNLKLNQTYLSFFSNEISKLTDTELEIKVSVNELVLSNNSNEKDTLFSENNQVITILGHTFNDADGILINTSNWTEYLMSDKQYPQFNLKTNIFIKIPELYNDVLTEIIWLFVISLIVFLIVVVLFYYSVSNLLKQKKNSDIKTDFINNITHEFNTPLSTIQISTKMLLNEQVLHNPDSIKSTVEVIDRQNIRLQKLLDQVIERSLSKDGEILLQIQNVKLSDYFNKVIHDFELTIDDKGIVIINSIKDTEKQLKIDPFYFSIVIVNLLNNAVKFKGNMIEIVFKQSNENDLIEISDNGIGIPKREHKLIFKQFYRVSENGKHNYKGLGLGLYYSEQILKLHKGSISVANNKNGGVSFTISLPKK